MENAELSLCHSVTIKSIIMSAKKFLGNFLIVISFTLVCYSLFGQSFWQLRD